MSFVNPTPDSELDAERAARKKALTSNPESPCDRLWEIYKIATQSRVLPEDVDRIAALSEGFAPIPPCSRCGVGHAEPEQDCPKFTVETTDSELVGKTIAENTRMRVLLRSVTESWVNGRRVLDGIDKTFADQVRLVFGEHSPPEHKLVESIKVGATLFGAGVPLRSVLERIERGYQYAVETKPEPIREGEYFTQMWSAGEATAWPCLCGRGKEFHPWRFCNEYKPAPKCAIDKTCLEYPRCRCGSSPNGKGDV